LLFTAWVIFHVLVSFALVVVVLLQSAKGEGLAGSAFGGGGGGGVGQAVFGGRGAAGFLSKATTVLAVVFFLNCGALAFMSAGGRSGTAAVAGESDIPERAQEEFDRQRRLYEQQQMADSARSGEVNIDDLMNEGEPPADTTGGGQ